MKNQLEPLTIDETTGMDMRPVYLLENSDGDSVARCNNKEHAARIVHCVNTHAALVEALKETVTELSHWNHWATTTRTGYDGSDGQKTCCDRINAARAALKLTKTGEGNK